MDLYRFNEGRPIGPNGLLKEFDTIKPGGTEDRYYFRAVTKGEFEQLNKTNSFSLENSCQRICTDLKYVKKYFRKNKYKINTK